jgi:TorA maturation chaperone TorD
MKEQFLKTVHRRNLLRFATLCEIMAGLVGGGIAAAAGTDRDFVESHLVPWFGRFFADLEQARSANFYARVGTLGRTFVDVETEAFSLLGLNN